MWLIVLFVCRHGFFVRSLQWSPFLSRSKNDRAFLSNLTVEYSYFRATETWPICDRVMPWRHQPDNIVATCDMRRNYPLAVSFAIVIKISHGCGRGRIRACTDRVAIAPVAALTALSLRLTRLTASHPSKRCLFSSFSRFLSRNGQDPINRR